MGQASESATLIWTEHRTGPDGTVEKRTVFGIDDDLRDISDEEFDELKIREGDAEVSFQPLPPAGVQSYVYSEEEADGGHVSLTKWWLTGTAAKDKWRVVLSPDETMVTVFIAGKKKHQQEVDFSDGSDVAICFRALGGKGELRFEGFDGRFLVRVRGPIVEIGLDRRSNP